jgi:hypothetical protein
VAEAAGNTVAGPANRAPSSDGAAMLGGDVPLQPPDTQPPPARSSPSPSVSLSPSDSPAEDPASKSQFLLPTQGRVGAGLEPDVAPAGTSSSVPHPPPSQVLASLLVGGAGAASLALFKKAAAAAAKSVAGPSDRLRAGAVAVLRDDELWRRPPPAASPAGAHTPPLFSMSRFTAHGLSSNCIQHLNRVRTWLLHLPPPRVKPLHHHLKMCSNKALARCEWQA